MFVKLYGLPSATERGVSGLKLLQQRQHILCQHNHPAKVVSGTCFQLCYDTDQSTVVAVARGPYAVSYEAHPVRFIPSPDSPVFHRRGRSFATTGKGELLLIDAEGLHVWDARSHVKRTTLPVTGPQPKTITADGDYVATASETEVCVWSLRQQRCLWRFPYPDVLPGANGALQLAVSEELDLLAFGGYLQDAVVHIRQASTGKALTQSQLPCQSVSGMCFHGSQLLVLSIWDKSRTERKGTLMVWDTQSWDHNMVLLASQQLEGLQAHHHCTDLQVRAGLALFSASVREPGGLPPHGAILGVTLPPPAKPLDHNDWQWVGVSEVDGIGMAQGSEVVTQRGPWRGWWGKPGRPVVFVAGEGQQAELHVVHKVAEKHAMPGSGVGVHISSFAAAPDSVVFTTSDGSMHCIPL